jgi:hypothetical protein
MTMMTKIFLTAAIVILLLLAGCDQAESTTVVSDVDPAVTAPYPAPTVNRDAPTPPYPAANDEEAAEPAGIPFSAPTPSDGNGVVIGQVLDEDTGEPLGHYSMVLGEMILLTPGPEYSIGVHERSSPKAFTDDEGFFGIGDVPPGTYVLLVWTPFQATVVQDPETGSDLHVNVLAGQTVELGLIETIRPRAPGE